VAVAVTDSDLEIVTGGGCFTVYLIIAEIQPNVAGRDYGRDSVLIDHLADRVLQQHDKLIERLDLSLQLDAIYQIDGNRDPFLPKGIQKWIL
jgi:hypothetical protein